MKKTITAMVISSIGLSVNAAEVIELNPAQSVQKEQVKSALILLIKNGLITRNLNDGKFTINSKEITSTTSQPENTELIDIDQLENDMRISHVTDF